MDLSRVLRCALLLIFVAFAWLAATPIPRHILERGDRYVIDRAGKVFFDTYVTLDSSACTYWPGHADAKPVAPDRVVDESDTEAVFKPVPREVLRKEGESADPPRWTLAYTLRDPSKPWVSGNISFALDTTGAWADRMFYGLSDCAHHPELCTFAVRQEQAESTAKRAGFKSGVVPWIIRFQWQAVAEPSSYAWAVESTTRLGPDGCSGNGETMLIDASTGKVLGRTQWDRICCH